MIQQLHVAGGNVDQGIPVATTGLDQHDACASVFGQPVGQHAAGRAGADDDIVSLHCRFPYGVIAGSVATKQRGGESGLPERADLVGDDGGDLAHQPVQ